MARLLRLLLLASALAAVVGVRAEAQPLSPNMPNAYPDPAAVLLPPVMPSLPNSRSSSSGTDLPVTPQNEEAFTPIRFRETTPERVAPIAPSAPPMRTRERAPDRYEPFEPAARLRAPDESERVKEEDFRKILHSEIRQTAGRAEEQDPFEYLTGWNKRDIRNENLPEEEEAPRTRRSEQIGDRIEDILSGGRKGGGGIFGGGGAFGGRELFRSDHRFDNFVSPTTNPFYFEDPRSLTEIRTIFMYQSIPKGQPTFQGGGIWHVGVQGRLAFTDRISLVVNKFGLTGINPGGGSGMSNSTGLSEIWIGPKVVLVQSPQFKTLVSAGATFQLPIGAASVYQNTGKLSIVPYVSAAQQFLKTEWGSFNAMASGGYSFATNRDRSDFFYVSGHLDFNIGEKNRFYPFIEANWFSYTTNGQSSTLGVEGRDLANIGAAASGSNLLTGALGMRFKINKSWEVGGAYEIPLVGPRDLFSNRFLFDLSWRY